MNAAAEPAMVMVRDEDLEAVRDLEVHVQLMLKTMKRTVPALNRLAKAGVFENAEWARDLVRGALTNGDERNCTLALVAEGLHDLCSHIDYAEAARDYQELVLSQGLTVGQARMQLNRETGSERRADQLLLYNDARITSEAIAARR